MRLVESQPPDNSWETYGEVTKNHIADQLKRYLHELCEISGVNYIGSVDSLIRFQRVITLKVTSVYADI